MIQLLDLIIMDNVICVVTWVKGVLLCSLSNYIFCFRGILEHALMLGCSKIALFFT